MTEHAQQFLDELLTVGFLTGSRAFGTARENSDYDIMFSVRASDYVDGILEDLERTPSNYFSGYFVVVDDTQFNLIPVHPCELVPWLLATEALKATLAKSGLIATVKKHAIFMGIVSLFKGTLDELGSFEAYAAQEQLIRKEWTK
jgi:hypothetical protein